MCSRKVDGAWPGDPSRLPILRHGSFHWDWAKNCLELVSGSYKADNAIENNGR